jgi:hypothetical protein
METCELKKCENLLGPGSSKIGYNTGTRIDEVKVCPEHTSQIMFAPRGTWIISPDKELRPVPAKPLIL